MSFNRGIKIVVCVFKRISFSHKKDGNLTVHDYMNGLEGIMLSEIKSNGERQTLYDFIYI